MDAFCVKKCSLEEFKSLHDKLRILSGLDWKTIQSSPRETNGFEMIPVKQIKGAMPAVFKETKEIMVFRFGKGRIAGVRQGDLFSILFIDRAFKLYDHG